MVKIKDETERDEENLLTKVSFGIMYSIPDTFEVKIWKSEKIITDSELINSTFDIISRVKENNAMDVFNNFYRDTYLRKE